MLLGDNQQKRKMISVAFIFFFMFENHLFFGPFSNAYALPLPKDNGKGNFFYFRSNLTQIIFLLCK
jgi:hypothetical protein